MDIIEYNSKEVLLWPKRTLSPRKAHASYYQKEAPIPQRLTLHQPTFHIPLLIWSPFSFSQWERHQAQGLMSCPGHRSASVLCRHHQHVSLKVFCHDDAYSVNTCLINQRALSARTRVLYARSPFIHSRCIRTSSLKCPSTQYLLFPQPPQPLARLLCMLNRANPLSVSSHSCCGLGA